MQRVSDTPNDGKSGPPPVRIVIATREPGPWFDATSASLADQDYPHLAITIVHEPGDAELLAPSLQALPDYELIEVDDGTGFGSKVNLAADRANEPLLLICHDDVALETGAISALVKEWLRRSEDDTIIAPKLVDWTTPSKLALSTFDADRFGETVSLVRPGDLDQGQHDRATEVFGVSTACVLASRSFFLGIGGFDEAMDWHGEDHELSLRTRIVGGRVVVASAAVARHRAVFAERGGPDPVLRERRHRMRSVLSAPSRAGLARLLAGLVVVHLLEFLVALVRLDLDELRAIPGAWLWNIRRVGSLMERRAPLADRRHDGASDLRRARRQGSVRLSESIDRRITQREQAAERGDREFSVERVVGGSLIAALLGFGARHLLTRPVPVVGEFRELPSDLGTLTRDWWSGWRTFGMGAEEFASFALPLLDVAGALTLGSESFLRLLLVIAPLPLGVVGVWRLFSGSESLRAPVAAAALYAASPLPYNAISGGSLQALLLYASLPWMLGHVVGLAGSTVFGVTRDRRIHVIGLTTLLAVVGAFVPWVGVTFALVLVGIVVGSFLAGDMRGVPTMIAFSALALGVAVLVNLPHLLGLGVWAEFGTAQVDEGNNLALRDIFTASTGPTGSPVFGWAVFAVAMFPLVSGHGLRFTWALRLWGVMLGAWALTWAGARGWMPVGLPVAEVLLVPAALGMAALGGIAALVIDRDLVDASSRRLVPAVVAVAGLGLALLPLLDGSFSGRWSLARADLQTSFAAIEPASIADDEGTYRTIWIGDAHVLGASSLPTTNGLAWNTSLDGAPDIRALWG
ncbi:MAG: glycosyltransferase, partial [Acidimicrobiales bacterium]